MLIPLCPCMAREGENSSIPVVRLHVTYQKYDSANPWKKGDNDSRSGYGCVLPSHKVITTAEIIKDCTFIKIEKSTTGECYPARVEVVDYDVDLALLTVDDKSFFSNLAPLEFELNARIDQTVHFMVFEDSGEIRAIPGTIVKVFVDDYTFSWTEYLLYGATVSFEGQSGGWGEPVFSQGKLIGLTMSYSSTKQYARLIPAPIIVHFIEGIRHGKYLGFPYHGFWVTSLTDPVRKKYFGLPPDANGIYVRNILPGGSAEGILRIGDVVTSVDGFNLDWGGNYRHPIWGRLDYQDRIARFHYPGETIELGIIRDGRPMKVRMQLKRFTPAQYLVPIMTYGAPPRYIIVGGLVIQELTVDYLRTWGKNWQNTADKEFLYYSKYEFAKQQTDRKRIIILSKVLPDDVNVGYQGLKDLIIVSVNGRHISTMDDVAEALRHPDGEFYRFTCVENSQEIILDRAALPAADKRIAGRYGISKMQDAK